MSLLALIDDLSQGAPRLRVGAPPAPQPFDGAKARAALRALDARRRREAPLAPPPLDEDAALWGALTLYRALQALVYRAIPADAALSALVTRPATAPSAGAAWAADLALRALPDVEQLARAAAPGDPLVQGLRALGRAFPLSAVGVPEASPAEPLAEAAVLACEPLAILYTDRVIERRDLSRLACPEVRERALAALGAHGPALAPEVHAAALAFEESTEAGRAA